MRFRTSPVAASTTSSTPSRHQTDSFASPSSTRCAGEDALGNPVEIEFAVRLPRAEEPAEFGFLQIRPLTLARDHQDLTIGDVDSSQLICQSTKVLGNGRIENLFDIVVVDSQRFERSRSQEVARAVAHFNATLSSENRPY